MKLLAFSDLHRNRDKARSLIERSSDADVVIGAGDFAQMRLGLDRIIELLGEIDRPTILVPGNNESEDALRKAAAHWPNASVLHGTATRIKGQTFFGLGGGVPPTPFPWSWDVTEAEARKKLEACPNDAVLIVHSPPLGSRRPGVRPTSRQRRDPRCDQGQAAEARALRAHPSVPGADRHDRRNDGRKPRPRQAVMFDL